MASEWAAGEMGHMPTEIEHLQQYSLELDWWRHQADDAVGFFRKDHLEWQHCNPARLDEDGCFQVLPEAAWSEAPTLEMASVVHGCEKRSPRSSSMDSDGNAGKPAKLFPPLMSPMRLPLGPEPVVPPLVVTMEPPVASREPVHVGQSMELPPGLLPPPGFMLTRAASLPTSAGASIPDVRNHSFFGTQGLAVTVENKATAVPTGARKVTLTAPHAFSAEEVAPGICIGSLEIAGTACTRVEWNIEDLRGKLRASMGRPLVSPPFTVCGLRNLRFMVFPDARDSVKSVRSRERKGVYASMIKKGPLYGALKLKADCLEVAAELCFHLTVGSVRCGPFTYNFSESAIHGCDDFGADWLKQVEAIGGNLRVGVEVLQAGPCADGPSLPRHSGEPLELQRLILGESSGSAHDPSSSGLAPGRVRGKRTISSQTRTRGC